MEISGPARPGLPLAPPLLERGPNAPRGDATGGRRASPDPAAHRLYVHLAWTTLDRLPLVDRRRAPSVEAHLIVLCRRLDAEPMQVRAGPDRIDVLVRLKPVHTVSDVADRLKRGSAQLLAREGSALRWGRGYAAATVAPGDVRGWIRRHAARPLRPGRSGRSPVDGAGSGPVL